MSATTSILPGASQPVRITADKNGTKISVPIIRAEDALSVLPGINIQVAPSENEFPVQLNLQEGFIALKEYLAQCKRDSAQLSNDISIAKSRLAQIETQLTQLKNTIHQKYKSEKELLESAIADTNLKMAALETLLEKNKTQLL